MEKTLPPSYSTNAIYRTIPQFIQDADAAAPKNAAFPNGYPLWYFLYGICQLVDKTNVITRDAIGPGVHIEADIGLNNGKSIIDALISKPLSATDTTIEIFNTDKSWNLIDTSVPFQFNIVDAFNNVEETVTIPAGVYNWTAPYVVLTGVTRGNNATYYPASTGADGSVYLEDYLGAPGWSQVVDINRCPNYALPWLGKFVGANIAENSGLSRQKMTQKIKERSGFSRATVPAMVSELVALINQEISPEIEPLSVNKIIVLENTQYNISGSIFSYNQYAVTLLLPYSYFSNYTYQSLQDAATAGYGSNYLNLNSYITSLGGLYFDLAGSTTPSSDSPYVNFVYRYRPAGIQIFVGGY